MSDDRTVVTLEENESNFMVLLNDTEYYETKIKPLTDFEGVKIHYGINVFDNTSKIKALEFDIKKWNKEDVKLFLRRYGKQVLSYEPKPKMKHERERQTVFFESNIAKDLSNKFSMPYEFNFIALGEGQFNGVFYSAEELKKSFKSLQGKDITIDHSKSVNDIVGKIISVKWNASKKRIEGVGQLMDETIAKKVFEGLLKGVSVEVYMDYIQTENGLSASNSEFVALSIVKTPACPTPQCGIPENFD